LPDNSEIQAFREDRLICFKVVGNRFTVADVGEQLAWLYGALQLSPFAGIASAKLSARPAARKVPPNFDRNAICIRLDCCLSELKSLDVVDRLSDAGRCWFNMFRNPVLVRGFPVLRRSLPDSGIEMPIDIITALMQGPRLEIFDEVTYFKGFSSLLYPTQMWDGQIVWHHEFDPQGDHLLYPQNGRGCRQRITFADIATSRNIVGWCSEAENLAGS
jgi:hypothetical protein